MNISYCDAFSHSFTFEEIVFDEIINMNNLEIGISKKSIIWYFISYRETTKFQHEFSEPKMETLFSVLLSETDGSSSDSEYF